VELFISKQNYIRSNNIISVNEVTIPFPSRSEIFPSVWPCATIVQLKTYHHGKFPRSAAGFWL
jgi:hypothetical protein